MRSENVTLGRQGKRHADGGRLLTDRQMSGAGVMVGESFVCALGFNFVENRFEFANGAKIPPDVQQILARVRLDFLGHALGIGVDGNGSELDGFAGEHPLRLDNDGLGHSSPKESRTTIPRLRYSFSALAGTSPRGR